MPLIRSKFKKEKDMIYISHLDLLRLLERSLRRAGIKPEFTQGFNQHPKISFAQALSLGTASQGEYVDIEIEDNIDAEEFKSRLNKVLPDGIEFVLSKLMEGKVNALMGEVTHARYVICIELLENMDKAGVQSELDKYMELENIFVEKKTKKGDIKQLDVKAMIRDIGILMVEDNKVYLGTVLTCGSVSNLKPELLLQTILDNTGLRFDLDDSTIQRIDIYTLRDGELVAPM